MICTGNQGVRLGEVVKIRIVHPCAIIHETEFRGVAELTGVLVSRGRCPAGVSGFAPGLIA